MHPQNSRILGYTHTSSGFRKCRGRGQGEPASLLSLPCVCSWKRGLRSGAHCVRTGYKEGSLDSGRARTGYGDQPEQVGRLAWSRAGAVCVCVCVCIKHKQTSLYHPNSFSNQWPTLSKNFSWCDTILINSRSKGAVVGLMHFKKKSSYVR